MYSGFALGGCGLRSLSQSLFVRLLKVAWISTILKVLVDLAEGESFHVVLNID